MKSSVIALGFLVTCFSVSFARPTNDGGSEIMNSLFEGANEILGSIPFYASHLGTPKPYNEVRAGGRSLSLPFSSSDQYQVNAWRDWWHEEMIIMKVFTLRHVDWLFFPQLYSANGGQEKHGQGTQEQGRLFHHYTWLLFHIFESNSEASTWHFIDSCFVVSP